MEEEEEPFALSVSSARPLAHAIAVTLARHFGNKIVTAAGKVPEVKPGYWVGIELDEPFGKNNGT